MHAEDVFQNCPRCANKFKLHKGGFLYCLECGLHYYNNPKPTTAVIIFDDNNHILLTKRGIDPYKGYWDLPGGFVEAHETLEESAKREMREELSIEIEVDRILGGIPDEYEYQNIIYPTLAFVVTAHIVSGTLKAHDDVEDFVFVNPKEALHMQLAFSTIPDAIRLATGTK